MSAPAAERDRDIVTWLGLAVVGVAAAVQSFASLSDLARMVGFTGTIHFPWPGVDGWTFHLAWLLPITVDVFAAVATRIWLQGRAAPEAVRFARRTAWAAIGAAVGGNAYHGYLTGHGRVDTVVISAVFPVALGGLVHLTVLRGRKPGEAVDDRAGEPSRRWGAVLAPTLAVGRFMAGLYPRGRGRAGAGDDRATRSPTGVDSNEVLAADLRRLNADRRATGLDPLGRDAVIARYRPLGSTRAAAVMRLADRPEPTAADRPHLVRDGEEAAG